MAIRLIDAYPTRAGAANSNYPHGSILNESAPDAGDGTPLEQQWGNDVVGFMQALLETADITPSGSPDTAPSSQHIDGLLHVARGLTSVDVAGSTDVTLTTYQGRAAMVRLTGTLTDNIDIIVPDAARHYVFLNETTGAFTVTVKTASGTGVTFGGGLSQWLYSDGTNVGRVMTPAQMRTLAEIENHNLFVIDANGNVSGYGQTIDFKTASFTLAAAQAGKSVDCASASAINVTVPPNGSVALPVGYTVTIVAAGTGGVTIVEGAGVTVRSKVGDMSIDGQWAAATLYKRATNEWVLVGALAP